VTSPLTIPAAIPIVDHNSLVLCGFGLLLLLLASACLSAAQSAVLALNRNTLRHHARHRHHAAARLKRLLERPEQLLAAIRFGNWLLRILAAVLATLIGLQAWGGAGALVAALLLWLALILFAELLPRTLASAHPEAIAYRAALPLDWLLRILQPLLWLARHCGQALARRLHRAHPGGYQNVPLQAVGSGAGAQAGELGLLQHLSRVTISDVMVPRNEVAGIDIEDDLDTIMATLSNSRHTRLPVYHQDLNNVVGILHMRVIGGLMQRTAPPDKAQLLKLTREAYFVPGSTPLSTQLVNFQKYNRRIAIVVDEYGEVKGVVTLSDILEEIMSSFASNMMEATTDVHPQPDGSYLIDGSAPIRDINRMVDWDLPTDGPKTLNGLLTEFLETIPESPVCVRLPYHCAEILQVKDNMIKSVRMWECTQTASDEDATEPERTNAL